MPRAALGDDHVFINCPFDSDYQPLFQSLVFAVHDAGFVARCALEVDDASQMRLEKTVKMIAQARYGIHDISRTELDKTIGLPRFNMPFELGVFLGCKFFGGGLQKSKSCLVLDTERHRYQKFLSDIAGQDIKAHEGIPEKAIRHVRDWLRTASARQNIPGAKTIAERYQRFRQELPAICALLHYEPEELNFADLVYAIKHWLNQNPLP